MGCGLDEVFGGAEHEEGPASAQISRRTRPSSPRPKNRPQAAATQARPKAASVSDAALRLGQEADALEAVYGEGLGLQSANAFGALAEYGERLLAAAHHERVDMPPPHGSLKTFVLAYAFAAWSAQEARELKARTGLRFGPRAGGPRHDWGWQLQPLAWQRLSLATAEGLLSAHIDLLGDRLKNLQDVSHPRVDRVRRSYLPALQRLRAQALGTMHQSRRAGDMPFASFVAADVRLELPPISEQAQARQRLCRLLSLSPDNPEPTRAQIRAAYLQRAREIHPDKWRAPEAHRAFVELQEAKRDYDRLHPDGDGHLQGSG